MCTSLPFVHRRLSYFGFYGKIHFKWVQIGQNKTIKECLLNFLYVWYNCLRRNIHSLALLNPHHGGQVTQWGALLQAALTEMCMIMHHFFYSITFFFFDWFLKMSVGPYASDWFHRFGFSQWITLLHDVRGGQSSFHFSLSALICNKSVAWRALI